MPSSLLILCHPLLLPPIPPSIRVFPNESTLYMRWPKYWSFSFSIIPSKEHPGLISFRMDWLDLLAVQGTLKSLLPHHSSKASVLRCSAFFTVQLSHPYMTTGKTIALTLEWDRRVGGRLGSHQGCQVPFRISRRNLGHLLKRCSGQGPHLAMTGEPRGFARVAAGFSSYDGDLSLPLGFALGSPPYSQ